MRLRRPLDAPPAQQDRAGTLPPSLAIAIYSSGTKEAHIRFHGIRAAALALGLAGASAPAATGPGSPAQDFPQATSDGAWSFFSDPRAIDYKGTKDKTYLGFIDKSGSPRVWSFDHATGQVDTFTLHPKLEKDDHDVPVLYLRKDARLTAFYQRHDIDRYVFSRTTTRPEDITAWGPEDTLRMPDNATYANPFRLDGEGGKFFLFDRSVDFHPTLTTSDDEGKTWSKSLKLIAGPGERPYVRYCSDGATAIHIAFTDGHPRNEPNNSIYYMRYSKGAFYKADGSLIRKLADLAAKPIEPSEADRVYDGHTAGKAWIWDIALDPKGAPVLAHSVMPTDSDHRYYYARWNGKAWTDGLLTKAGKWFPQTPAGTTEREPQYSGGLILDPVDPSIVYLSKPSAAGTFEIERWATPDSGRTWASQAMTSGSAALSVRPILPIPQQGQRPEHRMLFWMNGSYIHYTNYATGIRYYAWNEVVTAVEPRPGAHRGAGALGAAERDANGRRYPLRGRDGVPGAAGTGPAVLFPDRTPGP